MRYVRVNAPRMVHETVDGEVIVIDLATGAYYSLPGTASEIWQSIVVGGSRDEMIDRVTEHYDRELVPIKADIDSFLTQLLEEELIVEGEAESTGFVPAADSNDRATNPFAKPVLEKYTDMAELILLDPVHDVSALGWPESPDNPSSNP